MIELSHKELLRQLMYNPWTGIFYWKINTSNNSIKAYSIAGSKKTNGRITIKINSKPYYAHRLARFYVDGYMSENVIDHKDRVPYHNWISNLREVSGQCNQRNTKSRKDNTSGVKGVYADKYSGKWTAAVRVNNKSKYLGIHKDFDEAVCHRLAAEQCLDWEGCDSNSPAYLYVKENIQ